MSGLQWLYLSWLDNVVIVVKILAWLYPPILITERNVPNYELSKMRWNGKRIKRWASSLHLSSSPLRKTLEKEKKIKKSQFFMYRHKKQSNSQPSLHSTICWFILAEEKSSVMEHYPASCHASVLGLRTWWWGREMKISCGYHEEKKAAVSSARWIVPGIMLDFQFVAEKQEDDRSHAILRTSWMKAQFSIINQWQMIPNPGQCCHLSQKTPLALRAQKHPTLVLSHLAGFLSCSELWRSSTLERNHQAITSSKSFRHSW